LFIDNACALHDMQGLGLGSGLLNGMCSNNAGTWSLYGKDESTIVRIVLAPSGRE